MSPDRRICKAVVPPMGMAAASLNDMLEGFMATAFLPSSGMQTYSALAPNLNPVAVPKTWSPLRNDLMSLPTASTIPASSWPAILFSL
jgi:hypothetical protein